jgi:hypothetical protein
MQSDTLHRHARYSALQLLKQLLFNLTCFLEAEFPIESTYESKYMAFAVRFEYI